MSLTKHELRLNPVECWTVTIEPGIVLLDANGPAQGFVSWCTETSQEGAGRDREEAFEDLMEKVVAERNAPPRKPSARIYQFPKRGKFA